MITLSHDLSKLLIIGNSFFDVIAELDTEENGLNQRAVLETRLGGVFNISRKLNFYQIPHEVHTIIGLPLSRESSLKYLSEFDAKVVNLKNVNVSDDYMCLASILINRKSSERTSFVRPGVSQKVCITKEIVGESRFIHISYLDYLSSIDPELLMELNQSGIFVSADLCINDYTEQERTRVQGLLKALSLLFISDSEYEALFQTSASLHNIAKNIMLPKGTVVHFPNKLLIREGDQVLKVTGVKYPKVTTLGFGDNFVAYFYINYLKEKKIIEALTESFYACQYDAKEDSGSQL
jgi:sugar/nucleoside kinase (ribokinase family)